MIRSFLTVIFAFAVAIAAAQVESAPTVKVVLPKSIKAGATIKGTIEVTFAEGLHGYQNPPSDEYSIPVKVQVDTKGFVLKPTYPKGEMKSSGADPKPVAVYEGTIKIPYTLKVPKTWKAGEVKFTVSYQQCNDSQCYPPSKVTSTVKLKTSK